MTYAAPARAPATSGTSRGRWRSARPRACGSTATTATRPRARRDADRPRDPLRGAAGADRRGLVPPPPPLRRAAVRTAAVVIMLLVTPRVSPYADAKTYMLMAPAVTLLAALGAAALGRWRAPLGWLAAAGSRWRSSARTRSPTTRCSTPRRSAWTRCATWTAGSPVRARSSSTSRRSSPRTSWTTPSSTWAGRRSRPGIAAAGAAGLRLPVVRPRRPDARLRQGVPIIVLRRSPAASRPPANYRMTYRNAYYEVWRRGARPEVMDHLPLQALDQASVEPKCEDITRSPARQSPASGSWRPRRPPVRLDPLQARRSASWRPHPFRAGRVITDGPGSSSARVEVEQGGRYRAWIAGTFGRPVEGLLDGREIGAAQGVNTVGHGTTSARSRPGRAHTSSSCAAAAGRGPGRRLQRRARAAGARARRAATTRERAPEGRGAPALRPKWDWIERVEP